MLPRYNWVHCSPRLRDFIWNPQGYVSREIRAIRLVQIQIRDYRAFFAADTSVLDKSTPARCPRFVELNLAKDAGVTQIGLALHTRLSKHRLKTHLNTSASGAIQRLPAPATADPRLLVARLHYHYLLLLVRAIYILKRVFMYWLIVNLICNVLW